MIPKELVGIQVWVPWILLSSGYPLVKQRVFAMSPGAMEPWYHPSSNFSRFDYFNSWGAKREVPIFFHVIHRSRRWNDGL